MPRWFHTTTSSASIAFITSPTFVTSVILLTSGTDTYSSPALSAWAVAGGGCQRDGVGTECGFAIEHRPRAAGSADRSSRLDRAPHVANLGIEMISGGGPGRADQKVRDARIVHSCESKRNQPVMPVV